MKNILVLWLLLTCSLWAAPRFEAPEDCLQMVVVINSHWDDATASMQRYQREDGTSPWLEVGSPVTVNLGRTGLAWGRSALMDQDPQPGDHPSKKEGDGRSPAGLFPITKAFGHPTMPAGYRADNLPYISLTDQQCVDDATSEFYNQIVSPEEVGGRTWDSAETMRIPLYQYGLVVAHNCPQTEPGAGSCIFFHIERGAGRPTAGCTSMSRARMRELLLWLKAGAHPTVLQLPEAEYEKLSESWPGRN